MNFQYVKLGLNFLTFIFDWHLRGRAFFFYFYLIDLWDRVQYGAHYRVRILKTLFDLKLGHALLIWNNLFIIFILIVFILLWTGRRANAKNLGTVLVVRHPTDCFRLHGASDFVCSPFHRVNGARSHHLRVVFVWFLGVWPLLRK